MPARGRVARVKRSGKCRASTRSRGPCGGGRAVPQRGVWYPVTAPEGMRASGANVNSQAKAGNRCGSKPVFVCLNVETKNEA